MEKQLDFRDISSEEVSSTFNQFYDELTTNGAKSEYVTKIQPNVHDTGYITNDIRQCWSMDLNPWMSTMTSEACNYSCNSLQELDTYCGAGGMMNNSFVSLLQSMGPAQNQFAHVQQDLEDMQTTHEMIQTDFSKDSNGETLSPTCMTEGYANTAQNDGGSDEDVAQRENLAENEREDLSKEDIENFLENEKIDAMKQSGGHFEIDSRFKPEEGMTFETADDAHRFYNFYSFLSGFSIAKVKNYRTQNKKREGEITKHTIKCNKFGDDRVQKTKPNDDTTKGTLTNKRRRSSVVKTKCPAEMVVVFRNGIWKVKRVVLEHNHEMYPQNETRFLRSHKFMTDEEKSLVRTLNQCNIPTRKMMSILSFLRGGLRSLPYTKRDVSNLRTSIRHESSSNDMVQLLTHFCQKQTDNPGFFFSFDTDENNMVKNIFWSDARARKYYNMYGDCISFDTTYMTNKYNLPFAPFVGITGHGQNNLFGCALLKDETTDTFRWAFNTFLRAMNGKSPTHIITDQDGAMKTAIASVFPNAKHRNCLWHITHKAEQKLGPCFRAKPGLHQDFIDIIMNCLTVQEFETLWMQMVNCYDIGHVKYFQDMWASRHRWVPVFFKNEFYPFIHSTGRSEGMNAIFKDDVGPQHSILSFFREFERISDTILDREEQEDNKSRTKPQLWSSYKMEDQAWKLYNRKIFIKFQNELKDTTSLYMVERVKNKIYEVYQADNHPRPEYRRRTCVVLIDITEENYSCICAMFQKNGILCSHVLKVLISLNITELPDKYFLERWRFRFSNTNTIEPAQIAAEIRDADSLFRFNILSRKMISVASDASKSRGLFDYVMNEVEKMETEIKAAGNSKENPQQQKSSNCMGKTHETKSKNQPEQPNLTKEPQPLLELLDPQKAQTKGRTKGRYKSIVDQIKEGKYTCKHCGEVGHNIRNCKKLHLPPVCRPKRKNTSSSKTRPKTHGMTPHEKRMEEEQDANKIRGQ